MSRLFNDGAGITYDSANGKFVSVPFGNIVSGSTQIVNPGGAYEPFDYLTPAAFKNQVDNSLAGNMRDCGECHVGGGGMEYIPRNADNWKVGPLNEADRVPYRTATFTGYTSFNYFIDIFDEDGDGDTTDVLVQDFSKSGVLEMDCYICHLEGYDWEARKDAIRLGQFDASRAAGAGFGTPRYTKADRLASYNIASKWGTSVIYDPLKVAVAPGFGIFFSAGDRLQTDPPTANCAACHQATHQVDWKKRGEEDPSLDVHSGLGCIGCHERKNPIDYAAANGASKLAVLGHDPAKGFVGPWDNLANKQDNVDFKECDDCHSGTDLGSIGQSYGAPNPVGAHAAAGLTANILQTGRDGIANASHLDVIGCQSCHVTKSGLRADGTLETGGAFVDGTGPDLEGRLADHDNPYVGRTMKDNIGFNWTNDKKIHPGNFLTSFFLRDKNDIDYDVNSDGRAGGMDALLQTHIAAAVKDSASGFSEGLFADGIVGATEIQNMLDYYNGVTVPGAMLALNGQADVGSGSNVLLSFLTVPFTMSHSIERPNKALGVNGCTDCHGATGGIFNGSIEMSGDSNISWNAGQLTPMTKVNGMSQITYSHPKLRDKWLARSIPLVLHKGIPDGGSDGTHGIKDVARADALYEEVFQARAPFTAAPIVGSNLLLDKDGVVAPWPGVGNTASTNGFWIKLEVCTEANLDDAGETCDSNNGDNGEIVTRTAVAKGETTGVDSLLAKLAGFGGDFTQKWAGFKISVGDHDSDLTNDHFIITPQTGYQVRVHPYTNAGGVEISAAAAGGTPKPTFGYGILDATYDPAPIIPTCHDATLNGGFTVLNGRADMVAYLNALGADADGDGSNNAEECFSIGRSPEPEIGDIAGVTAAGGTSSIDLVADALNPITVSLSGDAGAGGATTEFMVCNVYNQKDDPCESMTGNDVTFDTPGTYRVFMKSITIEGKVGYDIQYITVSAPLPGVFTTSTAVDNGDGTFNLDVVIDPATLSFYDSVLVNFDDGDGNLYYPGAATTFSKAVAGVTNDVKRVSVIFKNGSATVEVWSVDITL